MKRLKLKKKEIQKEKKFNQKKLSVGERKEKDLDKQLEKKGKVRI